MLWQAFWIKEQWMLMYTGFGYRKQTNNEQETAAATVSVQSNNQMTLAPPTMPSKPLSTFNLTNAPNILLNSLPSRSSNAAAGNGEGKFMWRPAMVRKDP